MGDPWGGEKPNIQQIVKNKSVKKSQQSTKSEKNQKNRIFFYWKWSKMHLEPHETTLKSTICQKNMKSGKKSKKSDFLLKMVSNALGTPQNTFKRQKLAKKNIKSD